MKYLTQFLKFGWDPFAKDKHFLVTGCKPWLDYVTKAKCGTKVETIITSDKTQYQQKDGAMLSNLYEKVTFKCKKDVNIPLNAYVVPVNAVAKVYGDYHNQLSVTCDDIKILQQPKQNP